MKELKLNTQIGDEINVTVLFDYVPGQAETAFDDERDEDLTINGILVDGDESKDILQIIHAECTDLLEERCIEFVNQ